MSISTSVSKPGARLVALALVLPLAFTTPSLAAEVPEGVPPAVAPAASAAADAITAEALRGPIRFLSDDLLEGRGPGSRGDALTQLYLATTMEMMGLEPGAEDGSYLQPFDIVGVEAELPETWSFRADGETESFEVLEDWIATSGVQRDRAVVEDAEVVFVGYGIEAPEYDWDDFGDADLEGKVLLFLNNDPDWDPELFEGDTRLYYGRWTYKYESAARQGAAGAIIVHTTPSAGYPWQVVETSWSGTQFELPAGDEPRIEVAGWMTEDASRRLVEMAGKDLDDLVEMARGRDFEPVPLGITTSLALDVEVERTKTANVLGLLPGSDPELSEEVVVYTAHHDHLGVAAGDVDDAIYNGALDNAAGVSQVLSIARAMTELPERPRRSQLFLFVGAEEQGLLGSSFYANHPTFHPGRIAANLNFDGGNIWGETKDITLIGKGKSSLDAVAETVASFQGRRLVGDQFPDKGFYYRSDQFNFAKIGVPALYFDAGTEIVGKDPEWGAERAEQWTQEDYHQPSDELTDDWVWDGMVQDARLGFWAGLIVSESEELPMYNPGDEFAAAREAAVAEVEAESEGR